jgi:hypothetical protein
MAHNEYDDITAMSIASNGNIGIGTNNPSSKLHIYGSTSYRDSSLNIQTNQAGIILDSTLSGGGAKKYNIWSSIVGDGCGVGALAIYDVTAGAFRLAIDSSGTTFIFGNFTVSGGTKSWRIKHPILENKDLIHVCIEGPRADNLYRGRKQLIDGECEVNLDLECNTTGGMTEGCFVLINKNIQVFVSNNETFDKVIGSVVGNKLTVTSDNVNASCFIDWLVIGERNDNEIINNASTSSNGSIIVEIDREVQHSNENIPQYSNTSNNF